MTMKMIMVVLLVVMVIDDGPALTTVGMGRNVTTSVKMFAWFTLCRRPRDELSRDWPSGKSGYSGSVVVGGECGCGEVERLLIGVSPGPSRQYGLVLACLLRRAALTPKVL